MNVYVAGPWKHKDEVKGFAQTIREAGFDVVSRWHDTDHSSTVYEAPDTIMREEAVKDFEDISQAEAIFYFNLDKSEGKATELGIALATGMDIFVVGGKANNVFLHLPWIYHCESLQDAIERANSILEGEFN